MLRGRARLRGAELQLLDVVDSTIDKQLIGIVHKSGIRRFAVIARLWATVQLRKPGKQDPFNAFKA